LEGAGERETVLHAVFVFEIIEAEFVGVPEEVFEPRDLV